jgi:hypothetical protein
MDSVRLGNNSEFELEIEPEHTILKIKELIDEKIDLPPHAQKLILDTKQLADDTTASDLKLKNGSELQLILSMIGKATDAELKGTEKAIDAESKGMFRATN